MQVIQKNASEEFRIEREEFKGHDLVNVRVWFKSQAGDMRPSKKGVAIPFAKLDEIVEALQALQMVTTAEVETPDCKEVPF